MSLKSIQISGAIISVEAVSGETAFGKALLRIPTFLGNVKTALQEQITTLFTGRTSTNLVVNFDHRKASRLVAMDYASMRRSDARVPEGLIVDLLTYSKRLEAAAEFMPKVHEQMAAPLLKWINFNLSSPTSLASLSSTLTVQGYSEVNYSAAAKAIHDSFQARGQLQSVVSYGQAIRRNADWKEIDEAYVRISHLLNPAFHKQMVETLKELEISVDTLHQRLSQNPEKYKMSQTAVMDLVKHLVTVAEAYDFYAQLVYRVQELDNSCVETVKKILGD